MKIEPPKRIAAGDELTVAWLNHIRDLLVESRIVSLGPGFTGGPTPSGTILGLATAQGSNGFFKGKVKTGGISARTSDASHGTGSVEIWVLNSSGSWIDSGDSATVTSISSTTGGIVAGTWVNCIYRDDGGAEILSVDCGN